MGATASQITSLTIVYWTVYSGADQRKHQSSASLAFVRGIHRGPVNSPHKWPVTRKMFPFDDVIMKSLSKTCAYFMRQDECKYNSKITFVIVHYSDIIWASRCPQITVHTSVCSTVCSGWHQSSTLLARCAGNRPVTGGKPFARGFVRQFVLDDTNENLKAPHYWFYSTHKKPDMSLAFSWHLTARSWNN